MPESALEGSLAAVLDTVKRVRVQRKFKVICRQH